jgi:phage terminase small subunit
MPGGRGSGGHSRSGPSKTRRTKGQKDAVTDVTPPADLVGKAVDYWNYYAPVLRLRKLWTVSSRDVLRNYCDALVLRDRIQAEIETAPLAFIVPRTDPDGNHRDDIKAHPLLAQIRAVRLECRQHANDLCLPPAAAVRTPQQDEEEERREQPHDFYGGVKPPRPRSKGEKPVAASLEH